MEVKMPGTTSNKISINTNETIITIDGVSFNKPEEQPENLNGRRTRIKFTNAKGESILFVKFAESAEDDDISDDDEFINKELEIYQSIYPQKISCKTSSDST